MELFFINFIYSGKNQLSSLQQCPTSDWYLGAAKHFQLLVTELKPELSAHKRLVQEHLYGGF